MLIKEFIRKDSENKNRVFLELECDNCGSIYHRQKRHASAVHGCSPKCLAFLKGSRVTVACAHCGEKIDRRKSDLSKTKSGKIFCSQDCHNQAATYMDEIRPEHYGTGKSNYRNKAFKEFGKKCNRCGFDNEKALEVHHIDRNRDNNDITNLEVLCANCHRLEHN